MSETSPRHSTSAATQSTSRRPLGNRRRVLVLQSLALVLTLALALQTLATGQTLIGDVFRPPARIQQVDTTGNDIDVHVSTRCPVEVVIKSSRCGEMERIPIQVGPLQLPSLTVTAPNLLANVRSCGPQYWVELHGLANPQPIFPFRVGLSCPSPTSCDLVISEGIHGHGAIPLSPALDQAMTNIGSGGSDFIASLHNAYPSLADEIDTYALDLDLLLEQTSRPLNGTCQCHWTGVVEPVDPATDTQAFASSEPTDDSTFTTASLTMKPRCQRLAEGPPHVLQTKDGQPLVQLPAFSACTVSDPGAAEYRLDVQAWATAEGTPGYPLNARSVVEFFAGEAMVSSTLVEVDRGENDPDEIATETLEMAFVRPPTAPPQGVDVVVNSFASVAPGVAVARSPAATMPASPVADATAIATDAAAIAADAAATTSTTTDTATISLPSNLVARSGVYFRLWGFGFVNASMISEGVILATGGPGTHVDDTVDDGEH